MKWASLLLLAINVEAIAAVVEVRGSGFLKSKTAEVLEILPSHYLDSVNKKVVIKEAPLSTDDKFRSEDLCKTDAGVKFGTTKKHSITISSRLVELAVKNKNTFPCGHKTFENHLKAVIIHELTHVKDNQENISLDPDYQRIAGMKKVQRSSKKKLMNHNASSSPDAYEFRNLEESLAVNAEYLMLDPEFECRKPATAGFLSKRMNIPLKGECKKNHKVILQSAFLEDNYQRPVSIDPSRVYQIHYLFAGKGQALMSRWGHAMFRVIVCAPFRKSAGPECLDDVSHHLALSYRAYMSDININFKKGMFGGYPSQLFILRYLEVQQEYTKYELRDLHSIPLKLSSRQKKEFLDLTLERFWNYKGKYYFIDNNCGTETVKHLAVALSDEESGLISSVTPLKIYEDILRNSEEIKHLSREEMIEEELLVESMFSDLNESYQFLRAYFPSYREKSFKKFLKKTNAASRLADYENVQELLGKLEPMESKQVILKLAYLERYLAGRFLMKIPGKVIQKMNKDKVLKEEVMKMGQSLKTLSIQPWEVVNSSYGVPTAEEFESQFPEFLKERRSIIKSSVESQMKDIQDILGTKYFQKELQELEQLKSIKILTSSLINEMSR